MRDRLVRFTQPSEFNDPFEFLPSENFIPDLSINDETVFLAKYNYEHEGGLENQIEHLRKLEIEFASELQNFMVGTYDGLGVFCLTEEWDNILMWSHYANNHRGFVVGFNIEQPFFQEYEFKLKPIIYSKNRPTAAVRENYIQNLIYTKADIWNYEKEWRICKDLSKANKVINGNVYLYEIPIDAIETIYLGSKISDENKYNILRNMDFWNLNTKIQQMHMHSRMYKLTSIPIN